jgi:hypothetical protein
MVNVIRSEGIANTKSRIGCILADGKLGRRGIVIWAGRTTAMAWWNVSRKPRPFRAFHLGMRKGGSS